MLENISLCVIKIETDLDPSAGKIQCSNDSFGQRKCINSIFSNRFWGSCVRRTSNQSPSAQGAGTRPRTSPIPRHHHRNVHKPALEAGIEWTQTAGDELGSRRAACEQPLGGQLPGDNSSERRWWPGGSQRLQLSPRDRVLLRQSHRRGDQRSYPSLQEKVG